MIDKVTANARKPKVDEYGNKMLEIMNNRHNPLYIWGLQHISIDRASHILDIGCGGGKNLYNMSEIAKEAKLYGIDYSEASIRKSAQVNKEKIESGKIELTVGSVERLPYKQNFFDIVTAFETVYYWPDIVKSFTNVYKILKSGGKFLVCNEDSSPDGNEELIEALDMNIYSSDELKTFMEQAGFHKTEVYSTNEGRWICAVGEK